jgi:response regulator RpfG family c-di-GMP phosphodiesterase
MCHVENVAVAQLRITPAGKSDSEIVCLVDDDPAALKSLEQLLASDGFSVRSFNKSKSFLSHFQAHPVPLVAFFTKAFHSDQFVSAVRGALAMHPVQ